MMRTCPSHIPCYHFHLLNNVMCTLAPLEHPISRNYSKHVPMLHMDFHGPHPQGCLSKSFVSILLLDENLENSMNLQPAQCIKLKNKKMSASRVYDEFNQMFSHLPTTDQALLEEDKTLYFLKVVGRIERIGDSPRR